jgi:hypothetical protein
MGKISTAAALLLAGLLLTGCDKLTSLYNKVTNKGPAKKDSVTASNGSGSDTNLISRDLGTIMLTNHYETAVSIGTNQDCLLDARLVSDRDIQLTVTVETKTTDGKIHDMAMTEVGARLGKPVDVSVGGFNFTLTPSMQADN